MLTCRHLNDVGGPFLVYGVMLSSLEDCSSFTSFLISHPGIAKHMRSLNLDNQWLDPFSEITFNIPLGLELVDYQRVACNQVVHILRQAINLASLILLQAGLAFLLDEELVLAVSQCPNLKALYLYGSSVDWQWLSDVSIHNLSNIKAPIETFLLHSSRGLSTEQIFRILSSFANTAVRTLSFNCLFSNPPMCGAIWPHVRDITLRSPAVHFSTLDQAFPNVESLHISGRTSMEEARAAREQNVRYHARNWTRIKTVTGDALGLWTLSLRGCTVDLLSMTGTPLTNPPMIKLLPDILCSLSPTMLNIKGPGTTWSFVELAEAARNVRYLGIEIVFSAITSVSEGHQIIACLSFQQSAYGN